MVTLVLALIQKTSFVSAIYWSVGALHVSLLLVLLLLRLVWITFIFFYILYFCKLRFFKLIFLFYGFWFLFIFFFAFFVFFINCFFLLFNALTWVIFFQFFIGRLILLFRRIVKLGLRFLISSFWILIILFFRFWNSFFNFFTFFFLYLRRLISTHFLFLEPKIFQCRWINFLHQFCNLLSVLSLICFKKFTTFRISHRLIQFCLYGIFNKPFQLFF